VSKERFINARRGGFTTIINSMLDDPDLSLQAKGLLSIFLSNSNDWEIHMKEIIKRSKNGRDAHYKAINELIENGYFFRTQVMEKGKFKEMIYIFSDSKDDVQAAVKRLDEQGLLPRTENQETKSKQPLTENPDTGKPHTENQYNNNTKVNKPIFNNTKSSMYVSSDSESLNLFIENYQPTKHEQKKLKSLIDKHGEELCLEAVKRTLDKGKKENIINYISGILKNWAKSNLKTVTEVESHEAQYREEKTKKAKRSRQTKQVTPSSSKESKQLPKSFAGEIEVQLGEQELAATYEDIHATMKLLRSTEKDVLAGNS
jgi:DnaD/phage-associated family protein